MTKVNVTISVLWGSVCVVLHLHPHISCWWHTKTLLNIHSTSCVRTIRKQPKGVRSTGCSSQSSLQEWPPSSPLLYGVAIRKSLMPAQWQFCGHVPRDTSGAHILMAAPLHTLGGRHRPPASPSNYVLIAWVRIAPYRILTAVRSGRFVGIWLPLAVHRSPEAIWMPAAKFQGFEFGNCAVNVAFIFTK